MRIEHWWYTAPLRLRSIFRPRRVEDELDEELKFHLEHRIDEEIARGLSPEEARLAARRAMGGLDQRKEEIRDARRVHWLTDFVDDVRYAIRSLRRTPGLTAFIVVTLALGVGMAAAPYSMLDALVFRPYPVPHPGEVVSLVSTSRDDAYEHFSYLEYVDLRDHAKSYAGVIANTDLLTVGFAADTREVARARGGMLVSGNYFRALGVEPAIGRGFRDDEDMVPGRDAVVVLGPDFWKSEFGGDRSVVGKTIRLNGRDFAVIGALPESFSGLYIFDRPDFYVPLAMASDFLGSATKDFFTDRTDRALAVRGRLRKDATLFEARGEIERLAKDLQRAYPASNRDRGASVHTMREMRTRPDDDNWKFAVVFTTLALAVLLVACTNAAGLLLARARKRTREIAVRLAIGAGRFRLVRLLLTESLVLALAGGLAGVAVGYAGIAALRTFSIPSETPVQVPFRMDARVLFMSLGGAVVCALFCGLAPALQSSRLDLVKGLKAGDDADPGRRRLWGRNALVVAQIAMSLMLLAASFLMYRGFRNDLREGMTYAEQAKDRLLMVRFDPRLAQYDSGRTSRFYELLTERLRGEAGIRGVALTQNPPLSLNAFDLVAFAPEGFAMPPDRPSFTALTDSVDEGYFETMGLPILRGRAFRKTDTAGAPRVVVVNEHLAKRYWPNGDAVGRRIRLAGDGAFVEIVGIAPTIKYNDGYNARRDFIYMPLAQRTAARLVLLVRTDGDPLSIVPAVKDAVRRIDPNIPMLETRSYADLYRYSAVEGPGIAIKLVATLGTVALLLAVSGLYGLVAYNVSRRTREIGIRIAIGARPGEVVRLMMGKGLALVAAGTAIGLAMGVGVERMMNAMLFHADGMDALVYLTVVPAMVIVTMLAAWLPARRASRIPPTLALRCE